MEKQCCVCNGNGDTLLTRFFEIHFACPHNPGGKEASVHRGDCWTTLWEAYSAFLERQGQADAA